MPEFFGNRVKRRSGLDHEDVRLSGNRKGLTQESIELQYRHESSDADSDGQRQDQLRGSVHMPSIWQVFELSRMP